MRSVDRLIFSFDSVNFAPPASVNVQVRLELRSFPRGARASRRRRPLAASTYTGGLRHINKIPNCDRTFCFFLPSFFKSFLTNCSERPKYSFVHFFFVLLLLFIHSRVITSLLQLDDTIFACFYFCDLEQNTVPASRRSNRPTRPNVYESLDCLVSKTLSPDNYPFVRCMHTNRPTSNIT